MLNLERGFLQTKFSKDWIVVMLKFWREHRHSEIICLCWIDSVWACEWEWNIVEGFAHLHWSEQKLMENLPVLT